MSDLLQLSFAAELHRIGSSLAGAVSSQSPATGLALHAFRIASCTVPSNIAGIVIEFPAGSLDEAPQIATAGCALASRPPTEGELGRWREGLQRLSKRQAFTRDHQTFVFRPAELVGVALGIQVTEVQGTPVRDWLITVLRRLSAEVGKASVWNLLWSSYAASLMGVHWTNPLPERFDSLEMVEMALLLVLLSSGVSLQIPGFADLSRAKLEEELLRGIAFAATDERQVERLAVMHAGLSLAIRSQLERHLSMGDGRLRGGTRDALQMLELICRKFDRLIRALQDRYGARPPFEVNDEYDVQDLMHGVLLLHFDVVIPEDTVPARAGNRSRLDFLLKRERVVVETKMTRKGLNQSVAHDELVADRDRYKSHPDCDVLACLVYDPKRLFHNAAAFELDLNSDEDRPRMRVFVCPQ